MATGNTSQVILLLERLKKGAKPARDELILHSCDRMRRLTRTMLRKYPRLRRWEQTDDVFQNAVLRLYQSLKAVQPESPQEYFGLAALHIRRTLIDLVRHHFGAAGPGTHHDSNNPNEEDRVAEASDGADEPGTLDEWTMFHEKVECLPEPQREIVNLLWYHGLSQAETASLLNLDVRSVKRRWRSARRLLFASLDGERPGT